MTERTETAEHPPHPRTPADQMRAIIGGDPAGADPGVLFGIAAGLLRDLDAATGGESEARRLRDLLDDACAYLAATHRHANRHDVLGENLGCAGCALLDRIEGASGEHDTEAPDFHHCAMCGERCYWQESPHGGWWAHEVPSGGDHDAVAGAPCRPGADDYCEPPTEAPQNGPAAPAGDSRSPLDAQGAEVAQRGAVGRDGHAQSDTDRARRAEIARALHEYADRLDAVPLDCTALTGPVWYGQGWRDAVNHLRDLADGLMPAPSTTGGNEP